VASGEWLVASKGSYGTDILPKDESNRIRFAFRFFCRVFAASPADEARRTRVPFNLPKLAPF